MDSNTIAKEILTTRGVNSCVYQENTDIFQTFVTPLRTKLHVGLYDFDTAISKSDLLCKVMDMEGINILWLSSDNDIRKYHLWNLSCNTLEEILKTGAILGSDCKHVTHGYRQGRWVLRIAGKWMNGIEYKKPPKLLHTWCNPSENPQSKAHYNLFLALTGKKICEDMNYEWIGRSAQTESYMTITDRMKETVYHDRRNK